MQQEQAGRGPELGAAVCLWVSETWLPRDTLKPEGRMLADIPEQNLGQVIPLVTISHQKMASTTTNLREKPCQKNTQDLTITVITLQYPLV